MKRWIGAVVGSLLFAGALVGLGDTPAVAETPAQSGSQRFAACLNAGRSGDLLVLMDESASLRVATDLPASDPDDVRVPATQMMLQRLASSADQAGIDLSVSLASFGTRYDAMGGEWTPLTNASLPGVLERVEAFRDKDRAQGTDYWLGLDGARSAFVERQAGQDRCQAIVFFSDGALDIQPGPEDGQEVQPRPYAPQNKLSSREDKAAATAAAAESLCRPGGLADQIRTSGIVTLGVGLSVDRPDTTFDLMRGIATGARGGQSCGEQLTPTPGEFTKADSIDAMIFALTEVLGAGQTQEMPVCQGEVCAEGAHSLVLDATVSQVDVIGTAEVDGAAVSVMAPDGTRSDLARGASDAAPLGIPGVQGTYRWLSDRTVSLNLTAEGSSVWTGQWQIAFVDPKASSAGKQSRTSISVRGDLVPRWVPSDAAPVRVGTPLVGSLQITNGRGESIEPASILGSVLLDAAWVDPQAAEAPLVTGLTKERLGEQITIDPTAEGAHILWLKLDVTTAPATLADGSTVPGTALAPVAVDVPIPVLAPLGYPEVGARVDFGKITGEVKGSGELAVAGPGCVWLDTASVKVDAAPESVNGVQVSSPASSRESCQRLEDGAKGVLSLQLTADDGGNGGLNGTLAVALVPLEEGGEVRSATVAFGADLSKPLNTGNFVLALITALLMGPLIPIGLLYLYKYLFASKIPARSLQPLVIPVTLKNGRVERDGAPLALTRDDERELASIPAGGTRSLTVGGYALKTTIGASPMGPGHVVVEGPAGTVGASDVERAPFGKARQARLPLDVHNHWAVVVQPGDASRATLLMLLSGSAGPDQKEALVNSASTLLPGMVERLARETAPGGGAATPNVVPVAEARDDDDDPFGRPSRPVPGPRDDARADDPFDFGTHRAADDDDDDPFARR